MTTMDDGKGADRLEISGLEQLLKRAREHPLPPVETWDPPHCNDIGLRIKADGTWFYGASPIQRPAIVRLFSRVLRCENNGAHYLVTPVEKVDVAVEDAPFLAVEMEISGRGEQRQLTFRTNVDDVVRCNKEHPLTFVTVSPDDGFKPYILVRGRLKALVTRALVFDLVAIAEVRRIDDVEFLGVMSGGTFFPMLPESALKT